MNNEIFTKNLDSEIIDSTELIARLVDNITQLKIESGNQILQAWRAIIESIKSNSKNLGVNLASHSKIVDFKNGILLVEADHSSWLQMLQLHQRYILGCLQRRFPELKISTLAFRLKGSNVGLSVTYEQSLKIERAKMAQRYEAEEKYLESQGFVANVDESKIPELPQNLKNIFENLRKTIRQDMLTNEA